MSRKQPTHHMLSRAVKGLHVGRTLVQFCRRVLPARRPRGFQRLAPADGSSQKKTQLARWAGRLQGWFSRPKEEAPPPKGHLAVYVGGMEPAQRYVVPVVYCNHPLFGELLKEAEEVFGFYHSGAIMIPCSARRFERVRASIDGGWRVRRCRRLRHRRF